MPRITQLLSCVASASKPIAFPQTPADAQVQHVATQVLQHPRVYYHGTQSHTLVNLKVGEEFTVGRHLYVANNPRLSHLYASGCGPSVNDCGLSQARPPGVVLTLIATDGSHPTEDEKGIPRFPDGTRVQVVAKEAAAANLSDALVLPGVMALGMAIIYTIMMGVNELAELAASSNPQEQEEAV